MGSAARKKKKYFTVAEANQRLPLVRAIVGDIVRLYNDVHERRERLAKLRQLPGSHKRDTSTPHGEELQQMEDDLDRDIEKLQGFVDELEQLGVELKDPVIGLIDFRTKIDGREAYLCWKLGEGEIAWWHDLNSGYKGRQSLLETSLSGGDEAGEGKQAD